MGRTKTSGITAYKGAASETLYKVDKCYLKRRIFKRGFETYEEAQEYLARETLGIANAVRFGIRPNRTFRTAMLRYIKENEELASLASDLYQLKIIDGYIGDLYLTDIHMGSLQKFIEDRQKEGKKCKTINIALGLIRRILNLAASEWIDEDNLTWLEHPPKIKLLKTHDSKRMKPISWQEQKKLFAELSEHLREMATYKVNVGCREQEVCKLRWEWEYYIPELEASIFVIPSSNVKNRIERYHILNREAQAVIERQRGKHSEYVFAYNDKPVGKMHNNGWRNACRRSGIKIGVHVLKHTFGERLRAVGVDYEDRQELLGHKTKSITTHYSRARIENLIAAANRVCDDTAQEKTTTLVRAISRKSHATGENVIEIKRGKAC